MKTSLKLAAAAGVLVVGGGVVVWTVSSGDEDAGALSARLIAVGNDPSDSYAYSQWWSDGSSLARFGATTDGLVYAPLTSSWGVDLPDPRRQLAQGSDIKPMALAAQPGRSSSVWVTVGLREVEKTESQQPIMVWTPDGQDGPDRPTIEPQELPVDVAPVTSSETIITADAATTTVEEQPVALVAVGRGDQREMVRCDLEDDEPCTWTDVSGPVDGARVQLAATANGFIAVSQVDGERPTVWTADDAELTWQQVGSAPRGLQVVDLVDGDTSATLVW